MRLHGCSLCKWTHDYIFWHVYTVNTVCIICCNCVYIYKYIHTYILNLSTKLKQTCVKVIICYPQDSMLGVIICASSKWAAIDSTPKPLQSSPAVEEQPDVSRIWTKRQRSAQHKNNVSFVGLLCQHGHLGRLGYFLLDKLHMRSWYLTQSTKTASIQQLSGVQHTNSPHLRDSFHMDHFWHFNGSFFIYHLQTAAIWSIFINRHVPQNIASCWILDQVPLNSSLRNFNNLLYIPGKTFLKCLKPPSNWKFVKRCP